MVSVLAFYSYDLCSNPVRYFNFLFEKPKINEREAGVGPSLKKVWGYFVGECLSGCLKVPPPVLSTARGRNYGETEDGRQLQGGHQPNQDNASRKARV